MITQDSVSLRLLGFKALAPLVFPGFENLNHGGGFKVQRTVFGPQWLNVYHKTFVGSGRRRWLVKLRKLNVSLRNFGGSRSRTVWIVWGFRAAT